MRALCDWSAHVMYEACMKMLPDTLIVQQNNLPQSNHLVNEVQMHSCNLLLPIITILALQQPAGGHGPLQVLVHSVLGFFRIHLM